MDESPRLPTWAPRVKRSLIWKLYESDARGLIDEALIDEAGWALLERCKSFIAAVEAVHGIIQCPVCEQTIHHRLQPDEILSCPQCGWKLPWRDYFHTIQNRQLSGDVPVISLFQDYIDRFPKTLHPSQKMLLIDGLIHGFHWHAAYGPTRTTGVNLIEGNYHEVVEFLDRLTYGESSTPGLKETHEEWRGKMEFTAYQWQDPRLKQLFEKEAE